MKSASTFRNDELPVPFKPGTPAGKCAYLAPVTSTRDPGGTAGIVSIWSKAVTSNLKLEQGKRATEIRKAGTK